MKSKHRKAKKFRLLLDAAFARSEVFTALAKKANLAHVVSDFKLSPQATDEEIYNLAVRTDRFMVTINTKHFSKLVRPNKPGIICVHPYLSNDQIDKALVKFIAQKDPDKMLGKVFKI